MKSSSASSRKILKFFPSYSEHDFSFQPTTCSLDPGRGSIRSSERLPSRKPLKGGTALQWDMNRSLNHHNLHHNLSIVTIPETGSRERSGFSMLLHRNRDVATEGGGDNECFFKFITSLVHIVSHNEPRIVKPIKLTLIL